MLLCTGTHSQIRHRREIIREITRLLFQVSLEKQNPLGCVKDYIFLCVGALFVLPTVIPLTPDFSLCGAAAVHK